MAIAFVKEVQKWNLTTGSVTDVLTLAAAVAAGDLIVIPWEQENDATNVLVSVADSKSNSYSVAAASTAGSTSYCSGFAYAIATTALVIGDTITLTWTNSSFQFKQGTILEFSGVATSTPLDAASSVADTFTGGAVSIPVTTTNANDLIVAQVAQLHAQTYTVGGSFTSASNQSTGNPSRADYLYRIVAATGTYDPAGSLGAADNYRGNIISFKAAAGGINVSVGEADELDTALVITTSDIQIAVGIAVEIDTAPCDILIANEVETALSIAVLDGSMFLAVGLIIEVDVSVNITRVGGFVPPPSTGVISWIRRKLRQRRR